MAELYCGIDNLKPNKLRIDIDHNSSDEDLSDARDYEGEDEDEDEDEDEESESTSDYESDSASDGPITSIDNVYQSMSYVISSLTTKQIMLEHAFTKLSDTIDLIGKNNQPSIQAASPSIQADVNELRNQLKKMHVSLSRTLNTNISCLKKEVLNNHIPIDLIKKTISEEVRKYIESHSKVFDNRLNTFAREQRASLSQHIRKVAGRRLSTGRTDPHTNKYNEFTAKVIIALNSAGISLK